MISREGNAEIIRKMQYLAKEMNELSVAAESLPLEQRFGSSLMLAVRPWEIGVFTALRRTPDERIHG